MSSFRLGLHLQWVDSVLLVHIVGVKAAAAQRYNLKESVFLYV
jgi:hypothetical protein